jgi:hypothetical protein
MTMHRFPKNTGLIALLALALSFALSFAAMASAHATQPNTQLAAKKTKTAEPAKPVGEVVDYPALEQRVGQQLLIETTFKTTRRGTLVKYTQPALTLQLGPENGSIELTVPRETIKTITVIAPVAAADKDEGNSGAKKN